MDTLWFIFGCFVFSRRSCSDIAISTGQCTEVPRCKTSCADVHCALCASSSFRRNLKATRVAERAVAVKRLLLLSSLNIIATHRALSSLNRANGGARFTVKTRSFFPRLSGHDRMNLLVSRRKWKKVHCLRKTVESISVNPSTVWYCSYRIFIGLYITWCEIEWNGN